MPALKGCIPGKRYSPRWWRHPKDENVSLRAKRSNLFDRDCFVACPPRNDTPFSLMRCHCCSFDRLPLFWNAPIDWELVSPCHPEHFSISNSHTALEKISQVAESHFAYGKNTSNPRSNRHFGKFTCQLSRSGRNVDPICV